MTVIAVPEYIGFENCEISLLRATVAHRSPFTGKRQVVTSAFALWQFSGKVVPLQGIPAGKLRSFLVQLKGQANTFRLPVPAAEVPLSAYSGTQGRVNTASGVGTSIATDGWTPNTLIVADGDYFNIGDELKMATADILSNGAGVCTLLFEPPLRTVPADNTIIKLDDPFIYLSASDDEIAKWGLKDYNTHDSNIKAIEAFE